MNKEEDADANILTSVLAAHTQRHAAPTGVRNTGLFCLTRPAMMLGQSATGRATFHPVRASRRARVGEKSMAQGDLAALYNGSVWRCREYDGEGKMHERTRLAASTSHICTGSPAAICGSLCWDPGCGIGVLRRVQFYNATLRPMAMTPRVTAWLEYDKAGARLRVQHAKLTRFDARTIAIVNHMLSTRVWAFARTRGGMLTLT